jgi:putative transposase
MRERKSNRLKGYDYFGSGYYFLTICTKGRREYFGSVDERMMNLSKYGEVVDQSWYELPQHYVNCSLDIFVVMPNHVHGIIVINNENIVGNGFKPFPTHGLPEIIRGFKTFSSRKINERIVGNDRFQWQKSFYDHIIRSEKSLNNIREYIQNNPLQWDLDRENALSKNFNLDHDRYWKEIYCSV